MKSPIPFILSAILAAACRNTNTPEAFTVPEFSKVEVEAGETTAVATAYLRGPEPIAAVGCGFEYWKDGDAASPEKVNASLKGNTFAADLSSLQPGTQYSLRGWVDSGRSIVTSEVSVFQTEAIPLPAFVSSEAEPGLTDVRLTASLERSDNVTAAGFHYWKEDGLLETVPAQLEGLTMTAEAQGLDPFTEYGFTPFAIGLDGEEVRGTENSFRTLDLPIPVIKDFSVNGSAMDWVFQAEVDNPYWIEDCGFRYECIDTGFSGSVASVLEESAFSANPTSLYYSHTYQVRAYVRTAQTEVVSDPISFQTPDNPMDPTFFQQLLKWHDSNHDGALDAAECAKVTGIYMTVMSQSGPRVINGLSIFPNLTEVTVISRYATDVDLDNVPSLTLFRSTLTGKMKSFRVRSQCAIKVELAGTALKEISVSEAPDMETLSIDSSLLENVDLSRNSGLKTLKLTNAQLKTLDLHGCPSLTSVNVTGNPDLTIIRLLPSQDGVTIQKDAHTQIVYE